MTIKAYYQDNLTTIFKGDCIDVMKEMEPNSIDTIITDPPYGLEFMGKEWDKLDDKYKYGKEVACDTCYGEGEIIENGKEFACPDCLGSGVQTIPEENPMQAFHQQWATEALRVAKPGAFLLAFGGTRTHHRLMCAIEDAGWEIRDCMMWLYGSGFPKSLDISKAIDKTKGANRNREATGKTLPDIRANNYERSQGKDHLTEYKEIPATPEAQEWEGYGTGLKPAWEPIIVAMKPLDGTFAQNALKWGVGGLNIDNGRIPLNGEAQPSGSAKRVFKANKYTNEKIYGDNKVTPPQGRFPANLILDEEAAEILDEQSGNLKAGGNISGKELSKPAKNTYGEYDRHKWNSHSDSGGASRFFYCAKASKSERGKDNKHPTVKPLKLIEYLCRLTIIPMGGLVLDNFGGSGTTALACRNTGRKCILIEKNECETAVKRLTQEVFEFK